MRGEYEDLIRLQRVGHHSHHLARVLLVILGDIGEQLVLVVTMNGGESSGVMVTSVLPGL